MTPLMKDSPNTLHTIAAPIEMTYPSSVNLVANCGAIEAQISPSGQESASSSIMGTKHGVLFSFVVANVQQSVAVAP